MFQNRFDQFYLTICKQVGGIEGLLKSFFDFMLRKTDFFYQCSPGDKMGFPPGYNRQLLLSVFELFQNQHYKRFPKKTIEQYQDQVKQFKQKQKKQQQKKLNKLQSTNKPQILHQTKVQSNNQQPIAQKKQQQKQVKKQIDPILNTYNGGKTQKYTWSQETNQVEVSIEVEDNITSKQIQVIMKVDKISIKKKSTGTFILQGQLYEKINASQSVWKIERNGKKTFITFSLQKAQDKIWSTVFKGDPQIDTSKVENKKPLSDFDGQTQGAIRKIMYEQQRKMQGLPTTQQQKQIQALKMAWDAQGSPFKGQPFDPSKFNLGGSQFTP